MNYAGYEDDLYHVYESEVLGATMFGLVAKTSIKAEHRDKWRALAQLETQTMERYLDFVVDKPEIADMPRPSAVMGLVYGLLFSFMPWKTAMKMLSDGTEPFMEVFSRLQGHAGEEEKAFFDYVVAHEVAIKAMADRELEGDTQGSLDAVNALLDPA